MNKELLNYNLMKISDKLSTEQILHARRNRNWEMFDEFDEVGKMLHRLEEFQIYEDFLNDSENNFED